eukprot:sb/3470339/
MYTILTGHDKELQMCAKNAIQTYQKSKGQDIVLETVTSEIRPLLQQLPETKKLSIHLIEILAHLMELFPTLFNDKLRDQLLKHLKKWLENILSVHQTPVKVKTSFICRLCTYYDHIVWYGFIRFNLMNNLLQEGIFKFVLKHPGDAIDLFLKDLHEPTMNRMFYNFLRHKDGGNYLSSKTPTLSSGIGIILCSQPIWTGATHSVCSA